ncbi:MAG: Mrr restriction system protein [Myxococcota bacterium]|jgi:restriction system protein|nr:Mrr restriction system protein [Myxococcota bacterium]
MDKTGSGSPTFDKMIWPTLQALREAGGSATNQELLDRVVQIMRISEEVQSILHGEGPTTEVDYRLAWARTYLKNAGAIENSKRAVWSITAAGRLLSEADALAIPKKVKKGEFGGSGHAQVKDEVKSEEGWKDQLLKVLKEMPADGFERLAQRILRESGFVKVEVTGRSGDGGIDGIGVLRLTLISFQVFFQCKRYKETVSAGTIRDFRGAMVGRTDKGLVITTGRFTPDAKREASRDGAPPVELIDGDQLCELLKALKLGVKTELVEQVSVEPEFFAGV